MSAAAPLDRIEVRGLRCFGHHGVMAHEQRDGQRFVVDVVLHIDLAEAAASDALADTVDYGGLAARVHAAVAETRFDLIEALADHLGGLALADPRVAHAEVRVAKPDAPVAVELDHVAVVRHRHRERSA